MDITFYSYRFSEEILQHPTYEEAWLEIVTVLEEIPLFIYPGKSARNENLDVIQQVMNTYFDRRFAVDLDWDYHPRATNIEESGLEADFRKSFADLSIQVEVQFGNMARWYSDIFKFQTAYSQRMIHLALSVVPKQDLANRMDSNVVYYERALRELPSAELSITLPILLAGLSPDEDTPIYDLSLCNFTDVGRITKNTKNRWRIVNGLLAGTPLNQISEASPIGPRP